MRFDRRRCCLGRPAASQPKEPPPSTDIDERPMRDHVRVLASDDFQGRKPGTPGRGQDGRLPGRAISQAGSEARQRRRASCSRCRWWRSPPAADATLHVAGRRRHARSLDYRQGHGHLDQARGAARCSSRTASWCSRATASSRRNMPGTTTRALDVHGKTVVVLANDPGYAAKDPAVFKGNAMSRLRPLGLQGRGGRAAGRGGRVADPRRGGHGLSAGMRCRPPGAARNSNCRRGAARRTRRRSRAGCRTMRRGRCSAAAGIDFDAHGRGGAHPGFKAVPLGLQRRCDHSQHDPRIQFAERDRHLARAQARHEYVLYTAHWDSLGVDAARRRPQHIQRRGRQCDRRRRACWRWRSPSGAPDPRRSARSSSWPRRRRSPICWARSTTSRIPLLPLRQTAAVINLDMLHIGGPTRDVSIFGFGNSDLEDIARARALLQGREVRPEPEPAARHCIIAPTATALRSAACRRSTRRRASTTRRAVRCGARRSSRITSRTAIASRRSIFRRLERRAARSRI